MGENSCKASLNVSRFSPLSSLLKADDQLAVEFPGVTLEEVVEVDIKRLDDLVLNEGGTKDFFLKIDVQGFEMDVLRGAVGVLDRALVVVCEANFASLYKNQCAFEEITSFLRTHGLYLVDLGEPIRSRHNQEVLYLDLAFARK